MSDKQFTLICFDCYVCRLTCIFLVSQTEILSSCFVVRKPLAAEETSTVALL